LLTFPYSIVPIVACRLAQLHPSSFTSSPAYNNAEAILTEAELSLYLVLSSVTCLKPLFQPFHPGFFAASGHNLAVTGYTNRPGANNSNRERYYELSEGGASRINEKDPRDRKRPMSRTAPPTGDGASDEIDLVHGHSKRQSPPVTSMRPDEGQTWSEAVAGGAPRAKNGRRIEATRTWNVSYEDRD